MDFEKALVDPNQQVSALTKANDGTDIV